MENKEYNPIQDFPDSLKDKIKEWYLLREKVGKEKTFGDLVQRQENLEVLEKQDVSELAKIQTDVERYAAALGVEFDPKTGGLSTKRERHIPDEDLVRDIEDTRDCLGRVTGEHAQVTKALYGAELETKKDNEQNSKNPGVRAVVNERKQTLMNRDASAKKLLDAKVRLEAAKDRMDMHAALHVARKYRLMMRLEQAKLDLMRRVAVGSAVGDMSVEVLKQEIQGLANQIRDLEATFEMSRGSYAAEFGAAKQALDDSQKKVEIEHKEADWGNKYSKNYTYSDDGILNGSEIDGVKNGHTIHEQEIFDERGVMIFDVTDVLSREKTINVDGLVVTCVTEFGPGTNIEDSFYVGEMEALEVNTNGGFADVEEKPDMDEEIDNTETGKATSLNTFERIDETTVNYIVNGMVYPPDMLHAVPEEQRASVAKGLIALGMNKVDRTMNVASLGKIACESIAMAAEEVGKEGNPYDERKFTSDNG